MKIKLNRSIMHQGRSVQKGKTITVDERLGNYLIGINKAENVSGTKQDKKESTPAVSTPGKHVSIEDTK